MAYGLIQDSTLNSIAESIIAKDGGEAMTPSEMATRIDSLPTGGSLNILSAEDLTGYYAAANPSYAQYIDYDEMSTSGRTFIKEVASNTTPFSMSSSDFAKCFNANQILNDGIIPKVVGSFSYRFSVTNTTNSSITITLYDDNGISKGNITHTFTENNFGTTSMSNIRCSVMLSPRTGLVYFANNNNAWYFTLTMNNNNITLLSSHELKSFYTNYNSNHGKTPFFGGAVFEINGESYCVLGSTGKSINDSTGVVIDTPSPLVADSYSVAPFNSKTLYSTNPLRTFVGLCCGKIIPINNNDTLSSLSMTTNLPTFVKEFKLVTNNSVFFDLQDDFLCEYDFVTSSTTISALSYNDSTKSIEITRLISNCYGIYDIENEEIIQDLYGWEYSESSQYPGIYCYRKNGQEVFLQGIKFNNMMFKFYNQTYYPIEYDEDLDVIVTYDSKTVSGDLIILYDNYAIPAASQSRGVNFNSYGEPTALEPMLNPKCVNNGIINLEVE